MLLILMLLEYHETLFQVSLCHSIYLPCCVSMQNDYCAHRELDTPQEDESDAAHTAWTPLQELLLS